MINENIKRIFQISLGIILILSTINIIPLDKPILDNVSADSSWIQTTEADFQAGELKNIILTTGGKLKLMLETKYFQDNFGNESMISFKENVTIGGVVSLQKINNNWFAGASREMQQTSDGGYIITGANKKDGIANVWLLKTNSLGIKQWERTFGGNKSDWGYSVKQTSDNGYIISGYKWIYNRGGIDVWLIKTNSSGDEQWNKTFGGIGSNIGYSVQQTSDGGFIITGIRDTSVSDNDLWLIKTDNSGSMEWNKTFWGWNFECGYSVNQTTDSGYIITGKTGSYGSGGSDIWLIKTDNYGNEQWNRTYGGSDSEEGKSVQQTSDGGYILTGETYSGGYSDVWLIKTNESGIMQWNRTFGDSGSEYVNSVRQTSDGGFIIVGETNNEIWAIKTNSSGNMQWNNTYCSGEGYSGHQTKDGGYIITGTTSYRTWLIKTNQTGYFSFTNGEIISRNLITKNAHTINKFNCRASEPSGTNVKVQFSQNKIDWYNSTGGLNGWNDLSKVTIPPYYNSFDLLPLEWNGGNFYYRGSFTSDNENAPKLLFINITYYRYMSLGTVISQPFECGDNVTYKTMNWNATTPSGTDIKFQLRTATNEFDLFNKDFVGPDGNSTTFFTSVNKLIWAGHNGNKWIQYKGYLITSGENTPILDDVTIYYNYIPKASTLVSPSDNIFTNGNKPIFSWTFKDSDSNQSGFQVLIDNDIGFESIDYDSGEQSSTNQFWQFPEGTNYKVIADGDWYWKVRTKDSDGDWGPYTSPWIINIDTTAPSNPIDIIVSPSSWSSGNSFNIEWDNPEENGTCGIKAGIWYKLGSPPTSNNDGTWTVNKPLNIQSVEGVQKLYLWLEDELGNINYLNHSIANLKLDTIMPLVKLKGPNGGENYSAPAINITWNASDINLGETPISIFYSINDGLSWNLCSENESNDGKYSWNTSLLNSISVRIKVKCTDLAGNTAEDISDGNFMVLTDSDGDSLPDWWEYQYGLDIFNAKDIFNDTDKDGLSNFQEFLNGTNPKNGDTDYDQLGDGFEVIFSETDPTDWDTNGNGLGDGIEFIDDNPKDAYDGYSGKMENLRNDWLGMTISFSNYTIFIETNSSVLEGKFDKDKRRLIIKVTGKNGTVGITNLEIPKGLCSPKDIKIYLDDTPINYKLINYTTYYYIHIKYHHSTRDLTASFKSTDEERPIYIEYTYPENGQIDVKVANLSLLIKFNDFFNLETKPSSLQNIKLDIISELPEEVTGTIIYDADNNMLKFTPDEHLAYGIEYVVTISGLRSTKGVELSEYSWWFITAPQIVTTKIQEHEITIQYVGSGDLNVKEKISCPKPLSKNMTDIGLFFEVTSTGNPIAINIEITYSSEDLPKGCDVNTLKLFYWDKITQSWQEVEKSGVDTDYEVVWAKVSNLTIFSLMLNKTSNEKEDDDTIKDNEKYIISIIAMIIFVIILIIIFILVSFMYFKEDKSNDKQKQQKNKIKN